MLDEVILQPRWHSKYTYSVLIGMEGANMLVKLSAQLSVPACHKDQRGIAAHRAPAVMQFVRLYALITTFEDFELRSTARLSH